jgi:hypothetical protein
MSEEIKRIPIKEFRELGFLQEINRRLLHPCGLALEVIIEENGDAKLGGVWDYREDPEGLAYADDVLTKEKFESVEKLFRFHEGHRREHLGYFIQPLPGETNGNSSA